MAFCSPTRRFNFLTSVLVASLLLAAYGALDVFAQPPRLLRFEASVPAMGSRVDLVVYAESESQAKLAMDAGLEEIQRLSLILSNYDDSSEISRLCRAPLGEPIAISPDLSYVLSQSHKWYQLSDGNFDITVGPLTQLWREGRKQKTLPSAFARERAKQCCGWESVAFATRSSVSLRKPDMLLDLSGIAVGYIVDKAFEKMVACGSACVLINAGGDIRVGEAPPNSEGWRVTIAGLGKTSPPLAKLTLKNCAVTTSGDLNQYLEIDGRRFSHFIDPKTGEPIERRQSVTAIADTTLDADAGATALAVLGMQSSSRLFDGMPLLEAILVESGSSSDAPVRLRRLVHE